MGLIPALHAQSDYATPYAFTTLAGTPGIEGSADGIGVAAQFAVPLGIGADNAGNVYVADTYYNTIRKIMPGGLVTTFAGTARVAGSSDGAGAAALFNNPCGLAVDHSGNVYVADETNNTIRKITTEGVVTTVAGASHTSGSADGTGAAARFNFPMGLAVDNAGNVYVADSENNTVRMVTPGGVVTTLAGTASPYGGFADGTGASARFNGPNGMAVDSSGNVYVSDTWNNTIRKIAPGAVVTTLAGTAGIAGSADGTGGAAQFSSPGGLATDNAGNLYVADYGNSTIRMITPTGEVTTLAGAPATALASLDGTGSSARFNDPSFVAVDSVGNLYVTDSNGNAIRWGAFAKPAMTSSATADGVYGQNFDYTAAFSGALHNYDAGGLPSGLSIDGLTGVISGTVTANAGTYPVTIGGINGAGIGSGSLNIVIAAPSGGAAIARAPTDISIALGSGSARVTFTPPAYTGGTDITGYTVTATPTTGPSLTASGVASPITVAGLSGDVTYSFTVTATNGAGMGLASPPASPYAVPVLTSEPEAESVTLGSTATLTVTATGIPTPTFQWQLNGSDINGATGATLTIDNVQLSDAGSYTVVAANVSGSAASSAATLGVTVPLTYAASIFARLPGGNLGPRGVAVDGSGNVYFTAGDAVGKMAPGGMLTIMAGSLTEAGSADGTGASASFSSPAGLTVDAGGNLYVADTGNNSVRMVTPLGKVRTVVGLIKGYADGSGLAAEFNSPSAVAADRSGNVYVVDLGNNRLRKIAPDGTTSTVLDASSLTFANIQQALGSFQTMYTIAGVAVDAAGNPYAGVIVAVPNSFHWSYAVYVLKMSGPGVFSLVSSAADGNPMDDGIGPALGDGALAVSASGDVFAVSGLELFLGGTVIDSSYMPVAIAIDASGRIFEAVPAAGAIAVVTPVGSLPNIAAQPLGGTIGFGANLTLSVSASGAPMPTFQWQVDGADIPGATSPTYAASLPGTYRVVIRNSAGSVTSDPAVISAATRLLNISSRAYVGAGANVLIAGFVVTGPPGTTEPVLVRGIGPALSQFGVEMFLAQPVLTLFDSKGIQIATNTGWNTASNAAQIAVAFGATGAFVLPLDSNDSAILISVAPGAYTAEVSGLNSATGVALAEVYEVGSGDPELVNISTRAFVNSGSAVEIGGFVVKGSQPAKVLVRAIGPTLSQFGVTSALAHPSLSVVDSLGNTVASNTGWSNNANASSISSEMAAAGAFSLPSGSADCALLLTLPPGAYTAVVSGVNGTSGVALVEVYQAP